MFRFCFRLPFLFFSPIYSEERVSQYAFDTVQSGWTIVCREVLDRPKEYPFEFHSLFDNAFFLISIWSVLLQICIKLLSSVAGLAVLGLQRLPV